MNVIFAFELFLYIPFIKKKNVVFPVQAENSYFPTDIRLRIFLNTRSILKFAYSDDRKCVCCSQVNGISVLEFIEESITSV